MRLNVDISSLAITDYRGGLAITGSNLNDAVNRQCPGGDLPSYPLHITLATAAERKQLGLTSPPSMPLTHVYVLGADQRKDGSVRWLVVSWNHANQWRKEQGLKAKDFHVTLSETDDHEVDKDIDSLLRSSSAGEVVEMLKVAGEDALDHAFVAAKAMFIKREIAEMMVESFPDSYKGYARLGEAAQVPKLSALAFVRAAELNPSLLMTVVSRLRKLCNVTSYGPVVTKDELDTIPPALTTHLLKPWPTDLDAALRGTLWTCQTVPRVHQLFLGQTSLPRFFSWIYPGVAGMSTPRNEADVDLLDDMGITHVLTLTEDPLDPGWFKNKRIKNIHVPVENYHPPILGEMDAIFDLVMAGGSWLVHCGGGVRRAGTVLACFVAMLGKDGEPEAAPKLSGDAAISLLRQARPGSLETESQERFVSQWISHRWKLSSVPAIAEPHTTLQIQGLLSKPTSLFLIGPPGSGKSWFSTALAKRRKTVIINQDESSRSACERHWGRTPNLNHVTDMVILDRCNPTVADRKLWLSLHACSVAVYFDHPAQLLAQRLSTRLGHDIPTGKRRDALASIAGQMEPPTLDEFPTILTITSHNAAQQALDKLAPVPLLRFPRTPHLVNLGAATSDDVHTGIPLTGHLTIEEKLDGANIGISLSWSGLTVQNRSHWVTPEGQFSTIQAWLDEHESALRRVLDRDPQFPERFILYGEWMVVKHSVGYTSVPPFVAFDLYDRLNGFVSRRVLSRLLRGTGIEQVPLLLETEGTSREELVSLVQRQSSYSNERVEGVYVRIEDEQRKTTVARGKVVRGDFITSSQHWSKGPVLLNGLG